MADGDTPARVAGELYTEALIQRLGAVLVQRAGAEWTEHHVRRLAAALYAQQVGLVDLTRRQALVDEQIYGAALRRLRRAEGLLAEAGRHLPIVEMTTEDIGGQS